MKIRIGITALILIVVFSIIGLPASATTAPQLSATLELGKGLQESYTPYHSVDVYGHTLGGFGELPLAYDLHGLKIKDPTNTFDLSHFNDSDFTQQSLYHEVVVALAKVEWLDGTQNHIIRFGWFSERGAIRFQNILIEHPSFKPSYINVNTYAYLGYCPWEIWQNGEYRVEVSVDDIVLATSYFDITGIEE